MTSRPTGIRNAPPMPWDDTAGRHHGDGGGKGAEQGAEREQGDGEQEGVARPQFVGDPSGGRYQHAHRQHVGGDQGVELQRMGVEAARNRRNGRIQDGGVQHLHEERRCHQKRQVAQGPGGCRQFFHECWPPVSGVSPAGARPMSVRLFRNTFLPSPG